MKAEVLLSVALFALATLSQWGSGWQELPIDALFCITAALSAWWLVPSALAASALMLYWTFVTPSLAGVSGLAVFIIIYSAVRQGSKWALPITIGLTAVSIVPMLGLDMATPFERIYTVLLWLVFLMVAWGGGTFWRWAHLAISRERELARLQVVELRSGIARDLHDTVAQTLSHAALRAHYAMQDNLPEPAEEQLHAIADECSEAAHDLREVLANLRDPQVPVGIGVRGDLETTIDEQAVRLRKEGFQVYQVVKPLRISAARARLLAMVVVEVSNNMIKHADPLAPCRIELEVRDGLVFGLFQNGTKVKRIGQKGLGLLGITERLALLGGEANASIEGAKFILRIQLPGGVPEAPRATDQVR